MTFLILAFAQFILVLLLAPALAWFIRKMKAVSQNRIGPTLVQTYSDLLKLFHKQMVISETASWIFHAAPFVIFGSTLAAAMMIPVLSSGSLAGFVGDAILFVYLLALGRFFMALAALDTGTTFGGMGSSREMTFSSLAEPALLLALFALAYRAKTLSLGGLVSHFHTESIFPILFFTSLAFGALVIITIVESARIPVDNPSTHLELTMIHEAMILEYSGKYLALIEWSHQIKQILFLSLLANLFLPWGLVRTPGLAEISFSIASYLVKIFALAFLVGWIEIHSAKLRLFRVPDLLAVAFMMALLALLGQLMIGGAV